MKSRLTALLLTLALLLTVLPVCAAEETSNVPLMAYYECFAVPLGTGAIFEIPNEWGYQTLEDTDVPPTTSLLTDQNQMVMAMKLPARISISVMLRLSHLSGGNYFIHGRTQCQAKCFLRPGKRLRASFDASERFVTLCSSSEP